MQVIDEVYGHQYQADSLQPEGIAAFDVIAGELVNVFNPGTAIDVGCGGGALIQGLLKRGVDAYGIEGSSHAKQYMPDRIFTADLRTSEVLKVQFPVSPQFDLVTCTDVGEHIERECHETFCDTLAMLVKPYRWLVFGAAGEGQDGLGHVACVTGDTRVSGPSINSASRRWYSGQVLTIVTSRGNKLTVTPNHPILTREGWRPANFILKGDDLVCSGLGQRIGTAVAPHNHDIPSTIEEVFGSLEKMSVSGRLRVPLSSEDFHGDGAGSRDVDVVWADSQLRSKENVPSSEPLSCLYFQGTDLATSQLTSQGRFCQRLKGWFSSGIVFLKMLHEPLAFLLRPFGVDILRPTRRISHLNAMCFKSANDHLPGNSNGFSNLSARLSVQISGGDLRNVYRDSQGLALSSDRYAKSGETRLNSPKIAMRFSAEVVKGLPADISLDKVVSIHSSEFRGHVFNLSTEHEWYSANGIITHNCAHPCYWIDKFQRRGFRLEAGLSEDLRRAIQSRPEHAFCWWVSKNLMVFFKEVGD